MSNFNSIYGSSFPAGHIPNDPSLLPVVHSFHSDVPPTEGEEQALDPPLSLQHQVLVRSHSHFLPESCNLENRSRGILGFAQPSQTGCFRDTQAAAPHWLEEQSIVSRLEATCSQPSFPSQQTKQKCPFRKILTQCVLLVCQETFPTSVWGVSIQAYSFHTE